MRARRRQRGLRLGVAAVLAGVAAVVGGCSGSPVDAPTADDVSVVAPAVPGPTPTPQPSASAGATATPLAVAFYGDSYTYGAAASSPAHRWSTVLSAGNGWRELNFGIRGLGFQENRALHPDQPSLIVAAHPDLVIVMLGINDLRNWRTLDADAVHASVDDDLHRLRAGLPDTPMLVLAPMWPDTEPPAAAAELSGWLRDAASAEGAWFVPGSTGWLAGKPQLIVDDGLHPNDAGHALLAQDVESALWNAALVR